MTYQVSRNGQLYGPYTLQDLHRYIASGHVLATDLVKSDAHPDWITVAALLATQDPAGATAAAPPPVASPYASAPYAGAPHAGGPYAAAYPASAAAFPDPPDLPWLLALLIGIFTGGLFFLAWDIVIAWWARRIEPRSQALSFYIAATVFVVLNAGASYGSFVSILQHHSVHSSPVGGLFALVSWILRLVARFSLRNTLEAHFNGPEPIGLRLSGVMTFFFGGLYFQYKLNRINETKRAIRYNGGAI